MNQQEAWEHCVRAYGEPGRADELLRAQDEQGMDVVLHLFAGYASERLGVTLDDAALQEAQDLVQPWRERVVLPLRALRRALKEKPAPGAVGPDAGEAVRQLVAQAELQAERAQLDALCDWLKRRGAGG